MCPSQLTSAEPEPIRAVEEIVGHDKTHRGENGMVLQLHRIRWTEAWLEALDEPDSDTDTVVGDA